MKPIFFIALLFILSLQISKAQWQTDVRLTNNFAPSYAPFGASHGIAANGNVIHAVWYDNRDGHFTTEIYYKRSTDAGSTWSTDTRLTNDTATSTHPSISVSGLFVHVTWDDNRNGIYKVYYKRSTDGGLSWSSDTVLTNDAASSYHYSTIAASGSNLHVVWFDWRSGDAEIYYKNSTDNGDTWSADTRLSNTIGLSYIPVVAVSGNNVHVSWYDSTDGNWEIYYKRSSDNGISWGEDIRLTNNSYDSKYPTIAVSGTIVIVAWNDMRNGQFKIYYKRSIDNGANWGSDIALQTKKNGFGVYPCLAINGAIVNIVYQGLQGSYNVMYNKSINNGVSWGTELQLTSTASYPSIAVSGSSLHVIFQDNRDGNSEIYYKRNLTGTAKPIQLTEENSVTPNHYSLSPNYPNPFNPTTHFGFEIAGFGFVTLKVYNLLGEEVASLVNENLQPGKYEISWNASNYPSGVYYYTLSSGGFIQTNKMILLK